MISTITLNTSIDKAYKMSAPIAVYEVSRVSEVIDVAGGKGLNCARAIQALNTKVVATGFVGGNNGRLLLDLLDKDGVAHDFVQVKEETRCCINVLDPDGKSTEFLEPGRPVSEVEFQQLLQKIDTLAQDISTFTINGSTPVGVPADAYTQIIRTIKAHGAKVLLDTSGHTLASAVSDAAKEAGALPDLIKPNTDEMAQILGREVFGEDEALAAAKEIHARGVSYVVVSLGAKGALLVCNEGIFVGRPPKIELVNPVGSGDTMVGALAVGIAEGASAKDMLARAIACATANCLSAATGHFDPADVERLLEETEIQKLA